MGFIPIASTVDELMSQFSREKVRLMVREHHPKGELAKRSPFDFFVLTYEENYGPCTCELTRHKLFYAYLILCGSNDVPPPDYYVRCLLDGYRGSA